MLSTRPNVGANRNWGWSARGPINARAQLILLLLYLCFTWIGGVDSRYGSTADQGRTGREVSSSRLWRPARALGTHAKRGPSTGHSAVGLRQGECLLTPRPHFTAHHARLVTRWFVLRTALLFVRSAVRLVSAELPGPVTVCSPKQELRELGDRVLGGDRIVEHRRVQRAPPPPPLTAPPSHPRHGLPGPTQSKPGTRTDSGLGGTAQVHLV